MAVSGPIDPGQMRRINAGRCLRVLHQRGTMTLGGLAKASGLSRRTVELILDSFADSGHVTIQDPGSSNGLVGRPARTFRFNTGYSHAMSVSVGQVYIETAFCDLAGVSIGAWTDHMAAETGRDERIAIARTSIERALAVTGLPLSKVGALTIATPGVVHDDGMLEQRRPEWTGFSPAKELGAGFACSVAAENDAKLAAVGERWRGVAKGVDDFVVIYSSAVGIGVGIVVGGRLHRGVDGRAGEVFAVGEILDMEAGFGSLLELGSGGSEAGQAVRSVLLRARRGDKAAVAQIERRAEELAPAIQAIASILAPSMVVIGGVAAEAADLLAPAIQRRFVGSGVPGIQVRGSALGMGAVRLGALRSSLDRIESELFGQPDQVAGHRAGFHN